MRREAERWKTGQKQREKPGESLQMLVWRWRGWSLAGCCWSDSWSRTRTQTLECRLPGNHLDHSLCQNSPRHPGPTVWCFWSWMGRQNPPAQVKHRRGERDLVIQVNMRTSGATLQMNSSETSYRFDKPKFSHFKNTLLPESHLRGQVCPLVCCYVKIPGPNKKPWVDWATVITIEH